MYNIIYNQYTCLGRSIYQRGSRLDQQSIDSIRDQILTIAKELTNEELVAAYLAATHHSSNSATNIADNTVDDNNDQDGQGLNNNNDTVVEQLPVVSMTSDDDNDGIGNNNNNTVNNDHTDAFDLTTSYHYNSYSIYKSNGDDSNNNYCDVTAASPATGDGNGGLTIMSPYYIQSQDSFAAGDDMWCESSQQQHSQTGGIASSLTFEEEEDDEDDNNCNSKGKNVTATEIAALFAKKRMELLPLDIIVEKMHIHHGQKQYNPVNNMRFFVKDTKSNTVATVANEQSYQGMLPRSFEEMAVRVFCRDVRKNIVARTAFDKFCAELKSTTPFPSFSQLNANHHIISSSN